MEKALGTTIALPAHGKFIESLKGRVTSARLSAARAVNRDVILIYWDIRRTIAEKQEKLRWGDSVVETVARDLREAFPAMKGFSPQNVWRMLQFYLTHTASEFLSQLVREISDGI
jgi:predicted nuclease of restriction endonuclease-like (RecB) superfamily